MLWKTVLVVTGCSSIAEDLTAKAAGRTPPEALLLRAYWCALGAARLPSKREQFALGTARRAYEAVG